MALKDLLKVNRKTFFNPGGWIGYDQLKWQSTYLYDTFKRVFSPPQAARSETFEEAMKRLKLSEQEVKQLEKTYLLYAYAFFGLSIITLLTSIYLLFLHHTLAGFILGVGVTVLLLTQAFRYHFWSFQIKHRKLGCTFEEWKQGKPNEKEEPRE